MRQATLLALTIALGLTGCGGSVGSDAPADADAGPEAGPDAAAEPGTDSREQLSATQRALEELSAAYEELAGLVDRNSDEAVDWAEGDLENLGDWEYRIVEIANGSPGNLETELNALGNERWEAYWVESARDGVRVYLKRPSISYLSRVPLSALIRMLPGSGQ